MTLPLPRNFRTRRRRERFADWRSVHFWRVDTYAYVCAGCGAPMPRYHLWRWLYCDRCGDYLDLVAGRKDDRFIERSAAELARITRDVLERR